MKKELIKKEVVFEVISVLNKKVRTHKKYWHKIKLEKHPEFKFGPKEVIRTLKESTAVYRSKRNKNIYIYTKRVNKYTIIVVVRHLNREGFLLSVWQTTKKLKERTKVWPK